MLRLMIHDATCRGSLVGLSHVWGAGSKLYGALGRLDASFGATSWEEALRWLATGDEPIGEIQFWGHGKWGSVKIADEHLSEASLGPTHVHRPLLDAVRERMTPESLWWFRTCETFGAHPGQRFARTWTDHFGCRAAGHTYIIAYWQSGLHALRPGEVPAWSPSEGLARGSEAEPEGAHWSRPWSPNTISCLRGNIPPSF